MSIDSGGFTDGVRPEVNPTDTDDTAIEDLDPDWNQTEIARRQTEQPPAVPARPADGAAKPKWVDYVVALGADRAYVTGATEHFDPDVEVERTVQIPIPSDSGEFEDGELRSLIREAAAAAGSEEEFHELMRPVYERLNRENESEPTEPQFREEVRTERGGMVRSETFTRDELAELATRLGG